MARLSKLKSVCSTSSVRSKTVRRLGSAALALAWEAESISRTSRDRRRVSSRMEIRYFSSSSLGMVPSRIPSAKPAMVVMGVRSSWEMLAMNSLRRFSEDSRESAILLKESISAPISSSGSPSCRTRTEKSPLAKRREATAISSSGRAIRLEYTSDTIMDMQNTMIITTEAMIRKLDQILISRSVSLVTNTWPITSPVLSELMLLVTT